MGNEPSFETVKGKHEDLWNKYLNNRSKILADKNQCKDLGEEIKNLIYDIKSISSKARSDEEAIYISNLLEKWQLVLWSSLGIPFDIQITAPKQPLSHRSPAKSKLSEDDISHWIKEKAYYISKDRKEEFLETLRTSPEALRIILEQPQRVLEVLGHEAVESDFRNAATHFAKSVLDGSVDLARQLGPESYSHLETQWLDDVKQLEAYLVWKRNVDQGRKTNHISDYNEACEKVWNKLLDASVKASGDDFVDVKQYIQDKYLNSYGRIDETLCNVLMEKKLERLVNSNFDCAMVTESLKNKVCSYVQNFYENIVPAMNGDIGNVKIVLDTIEPRRHESINYKISDCFEMALIIYFISKEAITEALAL